MAEGDLRAAQRRLARARELEAETGATLLDELDEALGQRSDFACSAQVDLEQHVDADLERGEAEDRRRAGLEARDARRRRVVVGEGERRLVAEPAGQRLTRRLVPALGDEQEGRRARPAVEIFVAAADREIGARRRADRPAARPRCGRGPRARAPPRDAPPRSAPAMSWTRPLR